MARSRSTASCQGRAPGGAADALVWGVHAVREMVDTAPGMVEEVYVALERRPSDVGAILAAARSAGLRVRECDARRLDELSQHGHHQGVVARMGPFPYADLEAITLAKPELIVALDCVQDPRNLGAILRTADAVAAGGVLLPKDRSVGVTPAVVRGAAGHVCRVPVCRVTNLARTIEAVKTRGWWAVGLSADAADDLYDVDIPARTLLVVGGEGRGIRPLVAHTCDALVSLPMAHGVESLNASVAAGIALYEIARRRKALQGGRWPGRTGRQERNTVRGGGHDRVG